MKKTALAVFVTGALGVSVANAATVTEFANGVLVPRVISPSADAPAVGQTAVGLTSCAAGTVYWTFFDVNSGHILDDQFSVTANDQANLVWNDPSSPFGGSGTDGLEGYAVFILDTTGDARLSTGNAAASSDAPCLAGAAFQVYASEGDVAFIPTMPLNVRPLVDGGPIGDFNPELIEGDQNETTVFISDLREMDENTIDRLTAGANDNDQLFLRYLVDADGAAGGNDTAIYIWSTSRPIAPEDLDDDDTTNDEQLTVQMFDDTQDRRSLNIKFPNEELNVINPETLVGRPSNFTDGFIQWTVPNIDVGVISWSVITSALFNARQTVVNPIRLLDANGDSAFRLRVTQDEGGVISSEDDNN